MRPPQHLAGERDRRVDPVAVHAGVERPSLAARDREPVDELRRRVVAGGRRIVLGQKVRQHGDPGRQIVVDAVAQAADRAFDAHPQGGVELPRLAVELLGEMAAQAAERLREVPKPLAQVGGGRGAAPRPAGRPPPAGRRAPPSAAARAATWSATCPRNASPTPSAVPPNTRRRQPGPGSAAAARSCGGEVGLGRAVAGDHLRHPPLEAAHPAAAALAAADPAPQLGHLEAVEVGGIGAVGGVEQMVALVEHEARRPAVGLSGHRRLGQHQAWLAMTTSARRAARTLRSTKQQP